MIPRCIIIVSGIKLTIIFLLPLAGTIIIIIIIITILISIMIPRRRGK